MRHTKVNINKKFRKISQNLGNLIYYQFSKTIKFRKVRKFRTTGRPERLLNV